MANTPVVSVVIPTRNRVEYLTEAIASVQAQTFSRWELLIVDDASEDHTIQRLRSISDERVRVFETVRQAERSSARNRGLQEASGEYVIFLDDDDRFLPRALEVMVSGLRRHRGTSVACGARIEFDEAGHRRRAPHVRRPQLRALWPEVLGGWVAGPGEVIFHTEKLRSIGGWDETLIGLEDWELLLRASFRLGPVYLDPHVVREWRKHPAQWTPADAHDLLASIAREFAESLPPRDRATGRGAIRLRELFREAQVALHTDHEPATALRLFAEAYRSAPDVARSPMFRGLFARGLAQALLGRAGGPRGHRLLDTTRRIILQRLRRAPGQSYDTSPDLDREHGDQG